MPLSDKGQKIKSKMISQYGEKKGKSIFYAMENSGKLKGVLKAKGGADASKADFKTPSSAGMSPMSQGYTGAKHTSSTINTGNNTNNNTNNNTTTTKKTTGQIPVIGPLTAGLRFIQNLTTSQKQTHPFSANTIKQTKQKTIPHQNDNSPQLCPDGTVPPCKTPATQIKSPAQKTMFLSGFQSYDDGGEVVISSNVDKSLL